MAETTRGTLARQSYFFPPSWEESAGPLVDVLEKASPPFQGLGQAYKRNLLGTIDTLSMPFRMVFASVHRRRFQLLHLAECIRAREQAQGDGTIPEWAEAVALETARKKMYEAWEDDQQREKYIDQTLDELGSYLEADMSRAAAELLRQGVILTWGCLEVFVRDFFVAFVNVRREAARLLVESDQTKQLFQLKNVPFAVLARHDYNLQRQLGELLAGQYDLDSIPAMKAVFNVLFPDNSSLRAALADRLLWVFSQRRNLIVHRKGIVDAEYLEATGENLPLGSELVVTPGEVESYMRACCEVTRQLLTT